MKTALERHDTILCDSVKNYSGVIDKSTVAEIQLGLLESPGRKVEPREVGASTVQDDSCNTAIADPNVKNSLPRDVADSIKEGRPIPTSHVVVHPGRIVRPMA